MTGDDVRTTIGMWAGRAFGGAVWGVVGAGGAVVGSILVGWPATPTVVAAQALLPVVGVTVVGAAGAAVAARRPVAASCGALVALVAGLLVVPTMTAVDPPDWSADAARLTVFSANVRFDNRRIDDVLSAARRADADVVVLNEFVPAFDDALVRSGLLDVYPTVVRDRIGDGNLLLTRLPVTDTAVVGVDGIELPSATVSVGSTEVRVVAVHTQAPHSMRYVGPWRRQMSGLARVAAGHEQVVLVGDLNSSIWNPPLRRLLDWGFVDAQDATGRGTMRTWGPLTGRSHRAVIGIDHALSRGDRVAPLSIRSGLLPGSDHRSLSVTYAIRT